MTSSTTTIDAYARRVAAHLRLRGRHRREALTTLREDLLAAAGELGEAEAVAGFGPPAETAARLAEEHAPRERRWAVPVSLDPRGIADRPLAPGGGRSPRPGRAAGPGRWRP